MAAPLIALTTDFGTRAPYVAQVKGVLLSALPEARLLDVTHTIPPQSIRHAEVVLRGIAWGLPLGTVHLVVVDPGVGTERRPIAVQARGMTFVGPDNGVLGLAVAQPQAQVVHLDREAFFREPLSATFHGRDLFAPVAAELAAGLELNDVGSRIDDATPSTLPEASFAGDTICGEVLLADDFGNLTTNIPGSELGSDWTVRVDGKPTTWVRTYGEAETGGLLALVGSDGYLEVALRQGSAFAEFGAESGLSVICERGASA